MAIEIKYSAPGEGQVISPIGGDVTLFKAVSGDTGGAYFMMEQVVPVGHGPPAHVHRREEEAFYILEGEFTFRVGEREIRAKAGSYVLGPRDIPHRFWNSGASTGKLLVIGSPGGLEDFFVEYSHLIAEAPRDREKHVALAARYGLEFVETP